MPPEMREKLKDGKPKGPYTVWVRHLSDVSFWQPRDFDTLQAALEWEGKGAHRFVITKPVRYMVQEIGATSVIKPNDMEDWSGGPPEDPTNPDSGKARYV